jgi:alpha-beta hydrolase superfamily lysophospholipase
MAARQFGASGFLPAGGAVEIFYRFWEPESVRAGVLAFHALGAHGEWFETLAGNLLPRGFATLAPDLRGHGMTRWDLGLLPGPEMLAADARFLRDEFRQRNPGKRLFLLGAGFGGSLATSLAAETPDAGGLILLSPTFQPTYIGWKEKARMLTALLFGRDEGAATPLGRGLALCGDRLRLEWLRKDPLALTWLPARTHWNARLAIRRGRRDLARTRVPVLCVQGARDPVADPETNRRLTSRLPEARFVLWEEAYHDLALERDGEYLAGILSDWMRHQAGA